MVINTSTLVFNGRGMTTSCEFIDLSKLTAPIVADSGRKNKGRRCPPPQLILVMDKEGEGLTIPL
jgi:hypothetical protein